jgi:type 1 fimbria pilin
VHTTGGPRRFSGMTNMKADAARRAGSQWKRFAARHRWVVAVAAIGVMAVGSLAFRPVGGSGPHATSTGGGEISLQGKITRDSCYQSPHDPFPLPIGDTGCSITVNGYEVDVVQGNTVPVGQPGAVTGLDVTKNQAGWHAAVFAKLTGPHSASVLTAPKYHARISSGRGSGPSVTITRHGQVWLQGKITDDSCWDALQTPTPGAGDFGCSLTVNGYDVQTVQGNTVPVAHPGKVTGRDLSKNLAGRPAAVFAQLTGPHSASIIYSPKYYVRVSG